MSLTCNTFMPGSAAHGRKGDNTSGANNRSCDNGLLPQKRRAVASASCGARMLGMLWALCHTEP